MTPPFPEDWVFEAVPPSDLREGDVFLPLRHVVSVSLGFQRWDPGAPIPQATPTGRPWENVFHDPADMVLLVRSRTEGTRRTDHLAADAIVRFLEVFGADPHDSRRLLGRMVRAIARPKYRLDEEPEVPKMLHLDVANETWLSRFPEDVQEVLETDPVPAIEPVSAPPPDPSPGSDPR